MFTLYSLRQWLGDRSEPLKILDLCAAPGGKSTLLRELGNKHLIISNEVISARYNILKENLTKWGSANLMMTNHDVKDFKPLKGFFDVVLVDAPCSGEGLFRKDPKAQSEWSLNNVQLCSARQKRILAEASQLVAPNGVMVYCTCTYNRSENTDNTDWLVEELGMTNLELDYPSEWQSTAIKGQQSVGYQFYPHKTKGEGFFIAGFKNEAAENYKIRTKKKSKFQELGQPEVAIINDTITAEADWTYILDREQIKLISKGWSDELFVLKTILSKSELGLAIGEIKQKTLIPAHALAMSHELNLSYPSIQLEKK